MNLKLFDYAMEPVICMYIGEFIVKSFIIISVMYAIFAISKQKPHGK